MNKVAQSMENYEKYKNVELSIEKIAKSSVTFRKNKPNSPIVQSDASLFTAIIYAIFTSLTKVKNKPNQSQYKPKTNPIAERAKMNVNIYYTLGYNNKTAFRREKNKPKTNPIQTQLLQRPKLMQNVHILNSLQYKASSIIVL